MCVSTHVGSAVCIGAGMWVYLCADVSVHGERYGWVSRVLSVCEVKVLKERCRKGLDAVPPWPSPELGRCKVLCGKGETEAVLWYLKLLRVGIWSRCVVAQGEYPQQWKGDGREAACVESSADQAFPGSLTAARQT